MEEIADLYRLSSEIQMHIIRGEVPPELAGEILAAYRSLESQTGPGVRVAMRSSAIGEDAVETSFAGQYRSELKEHNIQCWVLDSEPVKRNNKYWDASVGKWVEEGEMYGAKGTKPKTEQSVEIASCSVPVKTLGPGPEPKKEHAYKPTYPWDQLDAKKWPNTWRVLMLQYFASDWWKGKYISESDWYARLSGDYRKEPPKIDYGYYGGYE